jgi:hypothetical protein
VNWVPGRQGTGYEKLKLAQGKRWDLYLLRYKPGAYIPKHTDPVPGKEHWRVNLLLRGDDTFYGRTKYRFGRLAVFRPDIWPHRVCKSSKMRLVLSLGFVL